MKSLHPVIVALVVIATLNSPALGVVVGTGELAFPAGTNNLGATFTPPTSLIQGLVPVLTGGNPPRYVGSGFGSWATVNDGIVGPANGATQTLLLDATTATFSPAYAVYVFDLSVNTFGYDITSVQSFSGWQDSRVWQNVEIRYALVGDDISGELTRVLGSYFYRPEDVAGYNAAKLTIEDTFGDAILTGVSAIEIKFLDNQFNGGSDPDAANYTAYKEVSVVGVASVPESSSLLLLGIAAAGALLRFRRK